jgi:hypothetical protein
MQTDQFRCMTHARAARLFVPSDRPIPARCRYTIRETDALQPQRRPAAATKLQLRGARRRGARGPDLDVSTDMEDANVL